MDTVQATVVTPVSVTPVGAQMNAEEDLRKTMQDTAQAVEEALNGFDDVIPETKEAKEKKATNYLNKLQEFIKGENFKNQINQTAKKYNVPPKKLAHNFFEKALGTVGDILGIAIGVVCNAGRTVITIAGTIANSIVNLVESIFRGIASIVTLNRTCTA